MLKSAFLLGYARAAEHDIGGFTTLISRAVIVAITPNLLVNVNNVRDANKVYPYCHKTNRARDLPVHTVHLGVVAIRPTTAEGAVKVIRDAAAVIRNDRPCLIVSNQMSSLQS